MSKKVKVKKIRYLIPILYLLILIDFLVISYLLFLAYFQNRIFPGVRVAQERLDHQTPFAAENSLSQRFKSQTENEITLTYQNQSFSTNLNDTQPSSNFKESVGLAYSYGRSGDYLKDLRDQVQALFFGVNFDPQVSFTKHQILMAEFDAINQKILKQPKNATISASDNTIIPSVEGVELDDKKLEAELIKYLNFSQPPPTTIPTKIKKPDFTTQSAQRSLTVIKKVESSPITLHYKDSKWTIDKPTLYSLLNFKGDRLLDQDKLTTFLFDISDKIDQPVQEAKFNFQPATDATQARVTQFQLAKEGLELDKEQTAILINQALETQSLTDINLPVTVTQPKVTTENINNFGIKELIGEGVSYFAGSIANRIYNIKLAASRINGTLIAPGSTFSFNNTVGDISAESGYRQAYVIKSGRTVLDDGGGVCQVSTTVFRAALNSGLPVTERTAHAYRVGYYEQGFPPGLDATVFSPSVDFKFKNDTAGYVLIQAYTVGSALYVDLYGTSDGRVATLTKPVVTDVTPPLPELRQDDPTLPKGTVKQVDFPAWGAKVSFKRTVTRGGQIILSETWNSNFRPWQAVYLVGTKT